MRLSLLRRCQPTTRTRIPSQTPSPPHQAATFLSSLSAQPLDYSPAEPSHGPRPPIRHSALELRRRMQDSAKAGNFAEALHSLQLMEPTVLNYNALLHFYFKSGRAVAVHNLVRIFTSMQRFGPHPNAWTFNILFNGLCALGFLIDSWHTVEEMQRNGFVPSFAVLKKLLKKSLSSGDAELSLSVVRKMVKMGYFPTLPALNSLVLSLGREKRVFELLDIFMLLLNEGFVPSVYTCNPILFELCKTGRSSAALSLFYNLKMRGFVHNVYSYTALVLGFCKERLWEDAYRILEQMEGDGCMPSVVTYTLFMKFLCKDSRIEEAFGLLEKMGKKGCDPDLISFNVLLHALCVHKRILEALEMLHIMGEKGFSPDQFTYCALAGGLLKSGETRQCQDFLLELFLRVDNMDIVAWNIYLHSLCHENRAREALSIVHSMVEKGLIPSNVTYNTILKGFCREQNIEEAFELLDHFQWARSGPDLVSFNTILGAACKRVDSLMIRRVLYRMDIGGVKFDVVSNTSRMQYFCNAGMLAKCFELFEHMISIGQEPTPVTYNVLVDSLCKKGFLEIAYKILEMCPNSISYNILIHASIRKSNFPSVERLLIDMDSRGLAPDAATYGSLTYGLCKIGKVTAALHLEDWMVKQGLAPNISYYNSILSALFRMGRLWDVMLILVKMKIEDVEPNVVSWKIFNRAMSKIGRKRFPKAMKFLEILLSKQGIDRGVEA